MKSFRAICVLLLLLLSSSVVYVRGSAVTDEVDTYHCVVSLQAGNASFNATANYTTTQLNTLTTQICNLVTPLLPTQTANLSSSCFVSYELTPLIEIHIPIATRGVSASYSAYSVLTSWTSASAFTPLANIRQRIFATFGVPSASTLFLNASTTIPCRSVYTRPGATPAPTLGPIVCASNTSVVPLSQDLVFLTTSAIASSSLSTALCDVLGTTTCGYVSIVSSNQANAEYDLLATTIRISATLGAKMTAMLSLVDATRRGLYPTLTSLQVRRVLMIPSAAVTGNTSTSVSLFAVGEGISPNSPPDIMTCNKFYSYWAFILLIFAPIFYIFFRSSYHAGRKKGIQLERQHMKEEEELREAEEQQREQQQIQQQEYHRSASQQLGASQTQQHIGGEGGGTGGYPSQPSAPPMDPSQWDPAMVAYVQQMLQQQQLQQQQQQFHAAAH
ncbi:membrane-associated protein, putative [Bodo saltans]|uniref:Membrane-associated protein, putative n=1 Tax=Bodo saltans TaxID=75058 RepID=A0A0S4J6M5_BODSA|nr:membrane-associated protein, putative [Bodo saltans]|eukprot:CUG83143.1 membrane-associated protein, putative [Bodo saltans]